MPPPTSLRCPSRVRRVLLDLAARQQTFFRLEDLSVPYAASICEYLRAEGRQSTTDHDASPRPDSPCSVRNAPSRGSLD